ncbi:DUF926-domain-containing protein [Dacryopinax primogenitus]|uniref:DUF926-domain-containing protein n=1 Tax=Dacryopinax primogenitus (strain DJM 731) TaxID=1858805 RepID=M5GBX9_DACPD|nr:DUF926-domain-containing protein [Dacryopinax primogenitus]EJU03582.1 DUF926-domain-containing protein [Dacryopinax primogenitus]
MNGSNGAHHSDRERDRAARSPRNEISVHYSSEAKMYTPPPDSPRRGRGDSRERYREWEREDRRDRERDGNGAVPRGTGPDMYASRRAFQREHGRASPEYDNYVPPLSGERRGGGGDWLDSRRLTRERSTVSIWPPSPRSPERDPTPERRHRKRYRTPESEDESEEERRNRRKHRSKHKRSRKERREEDSEDEEEERRRRRRDRERDRSKERDADREKDRRLNKNLDQEDEGVWVEADASKNTAPPTVAVISPTSAHPPAINVVSHDDDDDGNIGPQPAPQIHDSLHERDYGGALLAGEGSAIAAFVQSNERIPRRGEIGLTSGEIDVFEHAGYVMSGSRHKRMNAVRMRKENQVISAEEKRSLLRLQREEREKRESEIVGGFKEMLEDKLKAAVGPAPPPAQE